MNLGWLLRLTVAHAAKSSTTVWLTLLIFSACRSMSATRNTLNPEAQTSCCNTDSKRPHRCCHLPNNVENMNGRPDIPYALQWRRKCPPPRKNCPFSYEVSGRHLIHCSGSHMSTSQTPPQSAQSFSYGSWFCSMDTHTHPDTNNRKISHILCVLQPSVLWHCWLGISKSTQPVKIEWWGVGAVICLQRGADCLHMVQLMLLPSQNPIISCLI